jgi:hypothetical protein
LYKLQLRIQRHIRFILKNCLLFPVFRSELVSERIRIQIFI